MDDERQELMRDILSKLVDDKFLAILRLAVECYPGMDADDLCREFEKKENT